MLETESDEMLVAAVVDGDMEAFAVLVQRHHTTLLGVCRRLIYDQDAAQDAAQETLMVAFVNLGTLKDRVQFRSWLCGIGRNISRRWLSERARADWSWEMLYGRSHGLEIIDQSADPLRIAEASEQMHHLRQAIAKLPPAQRAAVQSFYLADLSHAETAVTLGVRVGAVKTRLHNARQSLKQILAHLQEDAMNGNQDMLVDMRVMDVRCEGDTRYLVMLKEVDGTRQLSFWCGAPQGVTFAMLLQGSTLLPVPSTPIMIAHMLEAAHGRVHEVRITQMIDEVIYAEIHVDFATESSRIAATWGDAVGVALACNVPIRVASRVLDQERLLDAHYGDKTAFLERDQTIDAAEIVAKVQIEHQAELAVIRQTAERVGIRPA